jgi:methyl acetate hydrolase
MANMSKINDCLSAAISAGRVPGVSATVGNADGVLYEAAFGERSLGTGTAMTVDTVCWIASMTKAVTGAAAMQMVEQGKLNLDTPAGEVCEYLGRVQVLDGFDSSGQPILRAPKRPVTLRHLLTHSAGFSYEIWNNDYVKYMEATGTPTIFGCVDAGLEMPLVFDPGDNWEYGINIDWAGKMVEAVSGQDLDTYMQSNLFAPLGMASTGFKITESQRERMAEVHLRGEDGVGHLGFEMPQEPEFWMGGGGLYSTVSDYLKFTRMILRGGELDGQRVLDAATVAEMSRNSMGSCSVSTLKTVHPFSNDANFYPVWTRSGGCRF